MKNLLKRALCLASSVTMLGIACALAPFAQAADAPSIDFNIETVEVTAEDLAANGNCVDVIVGVTDNDEGITHYNIKFDYDPRLTYVGLEKVNASIANGYARQDLYFVLANWAVANQEAVVGDAQLMIVTFRLPDDYQPGDSYPLTWSNDHVTFELGNGNNKEIDTTTFNPVNGAINVSGTPVVPVYDDFTIEMGDADGIAAGAKAVIPVTIYNNPALTGFSFSITAESELGDKACTIDNITIGSDLKDNSDANIVFNPDKSGVVMYTTMNDFYEDGVVLYITLTTPADAEDDELFKIQFVTNTDGTDYIPFVFSDLDFNDATPDVVNGSVTIGDGGVEPPTPGETTLENFAISAPDDLGYYFADNMNGFNMPEGTVIEMSFDIYTDGALIEQGHTVDLTPYIAPASTPFDEYWAAYNSNNPTFNYDVELAFSFTYVGEYSAEITEYFENNTLEASAIIGQRGDADLSHTVDTSDASVICVFEATVIEAQLNAEMFGEEYVEPALSEINNELALFLSDVNTDGFIDTTDAGYLNGYDSAYVEAQLNASIFGEVFLPESGAYFWSDILG